MSKTLHILQFTIGDHILGCEIQDIQKILPMMTMEAIPDGSDFIAGLINVGGQTISVFEMASCLQIKPHSYSEDTSILLTEHNGQSIGFIVDSVQDLFLKSEQDLQRQEIFDSKQSFYSGSILIHEKPCLIVKLNQLAVQVMQDLV